MPVHRKTSVKAKRRRRGTSKAGKASARARRRKSPNFHGSSRRKTPRGRRVYAKSSRTRRRWRSRSGGKWRTATGSVSAGSIG